MKCLSVPEAAARVGFSSKMLYRCASAGRIPVVRIGKRVLIDEDDLPVIVNLFKVLPAQGQTNVSIQGPHGSGIT
ncbi:MAG: helix-turn-helix domain-containing protein [Clostridia bacterium]